MPFDKFNGWYRAVAADPVLTPTDKFVLGYLAVFYVRSGGETCCVRQATVAEKCCVSRKAVNAAIGRAKRAGFLAVSRVRQRGTGHHGADELRLIMPELSHQRLHHVSDGEAFNPAQLGNERLHNFPESYVTKSPELCNQIDQSDVTKSPELCNRANSSASENTTPTGLKTGIYTGLETDTASADARTPEAATDENGGPPRYCPKHMPDGTDQKCWPCKERRLAREKYERDRLDRNLIDMRRYRTEAQTTAANCDLCDEQGWLLGPDGSVIDPATRCDHRPVSATAKGPTSA